MSKTETNNLSEKIHSKIEKEGPITFAEFMEIVLYGSLEGYYSRLDTSRDFYTSADVNPIFGNLLAEFFYKEFENYLSSQNKYQIIEMGSGTGKLAHSILKWFKSQKPDLFNQLEYTAIERSSLRRELSLKTNSEFAQHFQCLDHFEKISRPISGIIFSNEFFDAIPFHRIVNRKGKLYELKIAQGLKEVEVDLSSPLLKFVQDEKLSIPLDCMAEVCPMAKDWIKELLTSLKQGTLLTIDYGFEEKELYSIARPEGTAICHYRHNTNKNFYTHLGEQDITAHINFSLLDREGKRHGAESQKLMTQSQFLLDQGMDLMLQSLKSSLTTIDHLKLSSAIKSLIHPGGMGGIFKVLLQRKINPSS